MSILILKGFFLGFFFALVPGPTGYGIIRLAFAGDARKATKWLGSLMLADIVILFAILAVPGISLLFGNSIFTLISGIFLLGFAFHIRSQKDKNVVATINPFYLTLLNPAIWIGTVMLLASSNSQSLSDLFIFYFAIQSATVLYYLLLIFKTKKFANVG